MEMTLCKPCAMGMVETGKEIKQVGGRCAKITCSGCGRRRYGVKYEVAEMKNEKPSGRKFGDIAKR